jgi:hypothetical protein
MTTAVSMSCFHTVPTLTCTTGIAFPFAKVVISYVNTNLLKTSIAMCGAGDHERAIVTIRYRGNGTRQDREYTSTTPTCMDVLLARGNPWVV